MERRIRLELNEFWGRHCKIFGGRKGGRAGEDAGNGEKTTELNGPS